MTTPRMARGIPHKRGTITKSPMITEIMPTIKNITPKKRIFDLPFSENRYYPSFTPGGKSQSVKSLKISEEISLRLGSNKMWVLSILEVTEV